MSIRTLLAAAVAAIACLAFHEVAHADGFFTSPPTCRVTIAWDPGTPEYPTVWPAATRTCWLDAPEAVLTVATEPQQKADSMGPSVQPPRLICLLDIQWVPAHPNTITVQTVSASMGPRINDGTRVPPACGMEAQRAATAVVQWWDQYLDQYLFVIPDEIRNPPATAWLQ